jgi:hypothetical protein
MVQNDALIWLLISTESETDVKTLMVPNFKILTYLFHELTYITWCQLIHFLILSQIKMNHTRWMGTYNRRLGQKQTDVIISKLLKI